MNEWWEWAAWAVALATGIYSTLRWILDDRRRTATTAKWEIAHFQNDAYKLTSRLPYVARSVTLTADTKFTRDIVDAEFRPRAERTFMPVLHMGFGSGNEFTVTWHRRWWPWPQKEVLLLPPKPRR